MRKRVVLIALIGLILSIAGTVWYALGTTHGLQMVFAVLARGWKNDFDIDVQVGIPETPEFGRIVLKQVDGVMNSSRTRFLLKQVQIFHSPLAFFSTGNLVVDIQAQEAEFRGRLPAGGFADIPPPPPFACMLPQRNASTFESLHIDNLSWLPFEGASFAVLLQDLTLGCGKTPAMPHPLSFALHCRLGEEDVLPASFSGAIIFPTPGIEGQFSGKLLGQTLSGNIAFLPDDTGFSLTGDLREARIDVGYWFRWWQSRFRLPVPLTMTGTASLSGVWRYESAWGLSGNLAGNLSPTELWFPGLPFPLFRVAGSFGYSQNKLHFTASEAKLLDEPVTLSGTIAANLHDLPAWAVELAVPLIDAGALGQKLPWVVKYSLGWPETTGQASGTVSLQGVGKVPTIKVTAQFTDLFVKTSDRSMTWNGRFDGWKMAAQPFRWRLPFACSGLVGVFPVSPMDSITGDLEGEELHRIICTSELRRGADVFSLHGNWRDGTWEKISMLPDPGFNYRELLPVDLVFPLVSGR
jgi:hypothetical protein